MSYEIFNEDCLEGMKRSPDGASTGVAAINTRRQFIGFETEKNFYDIARERIDKAIALKEQSLF